VSPAKKPAVEQPLGDFDCCEAWMSKHRGERAEQRKAEKATRGK
jgi:hypothetical protein